MRFNPKNFISEHLVVNMSVTASALSFLVAGFYALGNWQNNSMPYQIAALGALFLIPAMLHSKGYVHGSRIFLSYMAPVLLISMSLYNKQLTIDQGLVDPVNYFDSRFIIIASLVIPMTIISLSEWKMLTLCLVPYVLCIVFYDPIHILAGVDYYKMGLPSTDYYFSANLFSIIATAFITFGFVILKYKLERKEHDLNARRGRLASYMNELIRVSSSDPILEGNKDKAYAEIARTIEQVMVNDRVSIWEFDKSYEKKRCVLMSYKGEIMHEDIVMERKDFPDYFDEIIKSKILVAEDAMNNKSLSAFKGAYLEPRGIKSMLEIAFRANGRVAGVICSQGMGEKRQYFIEDIIYLKAMADTLSYMHANRKQKMHNEDLEQRVRERTAEIAKKNRQLQEYAYINSHILRAPVARVHGLYHLLELEVLDENVLKHLKQSIMELNAITRKISMAIEDLGEFDRELLN